MDVDCVVSTLRGAGFRGDANALSKGDISVSVRDRTVLVSYKFSMVGFVLDGMNIDYSSLGAIGLLTIIDKCGTCMNLDV